MVSLTSNREMLDERQHFLNGAESTCWEVLGGYSFPRIHPLEAVCFQTVKQEIRRIPILKLRLAVELLNKISISYEVLFCCANPSRSLIHMEDSRQLSFLTVHTTIVNL